MVRTATAVTWGWLCGRRLHFGNEVGGPASAAPDGVLQDLTVPELEDMCLVAAVLDFVFGPRQGELDEFPIWNVGSADVGEAARLGVPFCQFRCHRRGASDLVAPVGDGGIEDHFVTEDFGGDLSAGDTRKEPVDHGVVAHYSAFVRIGSISL